MILLLTLLILLSGRGVCNSLSLESMYSEARRVRALHGPEQARSLYQEILSRNHHDRTAATRIAADPTAIDHHNQLGRVGNIKQRRRFVTLLQSMNYHPSAIADIVFSIDRDKAAKAKISSAPLYLQPLRAGLPSPPTPSCPLSACIQLLLLAATVPIETCTQLLGDELVHLMQELGIAFPLDNLLVPYCHVMPVAVAERTIYIVTDLHPNVLSITKFTGRTTNSQFDGDESPVMYIGPDSLALVDHWCSIQNPSPRDVILDVGTGSGIQALTLAARSHGNVTVHCVDINPRALRLTRLNFEWNGFDTPSLFLGNVNGAVGQVFESDICVPRCQPWKELLGSTATFLVSNPPFLPVPIDDPVISERYGLFSSGGSSGEAFLESLVALAAEVLAPESWKMAIVSEFMNPDADFDQRLKGWWRRRNTKRRLLAKAILFTNQEAVDSSKYARRRADDPEEIIRWTEHLQKERISSISPGLLFLKCLGRTDESSDATTGGSVVDYVHYLVPKTAEGSIWTPHNPHARKSTRKTLTDLSFLE
jgi:methylase of polypeptide subunit release factors